jgi:hypothetical protein
MQKQDPLVTIPLSEYNRLQGKSFYEMTKELNIMKKLFVAIFMNGFSEQTLKRFNQENGCEVFISKPKGMGIAADSEMTIKFYDNKKAGQ